MDREQCEDPVERIAIALEILVREQAFGFMAKLERQLDRIEGKVNKIMATVQDLERELGEINATTDTMSDTLNEINDDIDELIAGQGAGIPQSLLDGLQAFKAKNTTLADSLKTVAAKHPAQ